MKFKVQSFKFKVLLLVTTYSLLVTTLGCDAFVRKFTRKSKRTAPKEEMVLAPQEYKPPQRTKEEVYRQYFLFWKSWQDELINAFIRGASQKKQLDCINEALKNLDKLRTTLAEDRQKELDRYISQLKDLQGLIAADTYGNDVQKNRLSAERIKRSILRDFSYSKVKNSLV